MLREFFKHNHSLNVSTFAELPLSIMADSSVYHCNSRVLVKFFPYSQGHRGCRSKFIIYLFSHLNRSAYCAPRTPSSSAHALKPLLRARHSRSLPQSRFSIFILRLTLLATTNPTHFQLHLLPSYYPASNQSRRPQSQKPFPMSGSFTFLLLLVGGSKLWGGRDDGKMAITDEREGCV